MPSLDIIIVNWNAGNQLSACLESVLKTRRDGFRLERVVVVDNGSVDGSADCLEFDNLPLDIVRNRGNIGFAAACNLGASQSHADYLLFLNPDTELFDDSLSIPIQFMERAENSTTGICGIQLVDKTGHVAQSCARFPKPRMFFGKMSGMDVIAPRLFPKHYMTEWDHNHTRVVDQVMGAFFLIRCSLYSSLGGFDERFFVYFEEVDLSYRAYKAGWDTMFLAETRAYHAVGGTTCQVKAERLFYNLRSRILYGYKNYGRASATALFLGTVFIEPAARIIRAALHCSFTQIKETIGGYSMLYGSLLGIPRGKRTY